MTDGLYGLKTGMVMAIVISVLLCCIIGVVNGIIVSRTKIDPFIVTLGTQTVVRGVVYIVSDNTAVTSFPRLLRA